MVKRIFISICISLASAGILHAQDTALDTLAVDSVTVDTMAVDSALSPAGAAAHRLASAQKKAKAAKKDKEKKEPRMLDGIAVGVDLVGPVMKATGCDWDQMEAFVRVSLKDRFFPVFELGIGEADHTGRDLDNHYKVRAPYFRLGCDYNFVKKKGTGNRVLGGVRYGFSSYKFDFDSPTPLVDPVWGTSKPLSITGIAASTHWLEAVIGLEAKVWGIFHVGWDMRFRFRLAQKGASTGDPWYTPGYGTVPETIGWGGTFRLIFDI